MLEDQIKQVEQTARARIQEAQSMEALEAVRVDVLGRKGSLGQFSKEF